MVDGHIIKLDAFATIRAMAIETIVNISSIHTLETVSYPHANISRASDNPSCRGNLFDYEGRTYYDSSFSSLFLRVLNRLTALSKSLSNILISRSR